MATGFTTFIDVLSHSAADIDTLADVQERAGRIEKSIDAAARWQRLCRRAGSGNHEGLSCYGHALFFICYWTQCVVLILV